MTYPYSKRPARPTGPTAGIREESVGDYSGLRIQSETFFFGGPTSRMGYNVALGGRIVNGGGLAVGATYPLTLAQRVEAGAPAPAGQQYMPVPMNVTVNVVSGAATTDRFSITVYGENQFGGQQYENFTLTAAVIGDNATRGQKIFSKVTAVIVNSRSAEAAGLVVVYVGASVAAVAGVPSPRFGLPIHIESRDDVQVLHLAAYQESALLTSPGPGAVTGALLAASLDVRTDGNFIVHLAEQAFEFTGAAITALSDAVTVWTYIYLHIRTARGLVKRTARVSYATLKGGS